MVDESPGQRTHHEATRELVLEESKVQQSKVSPVSPVRAGVAGEEEAGPGGDHDHTRSFSSVTSSSQLTVSRSNTTADNTRRFSNLSNLARSLPSDSRHNIQPITGSLDLAAILDPCYTTDGVRKRSGHGRAHRVRRTKSALVTSPGGGSGVSVPSHPVSLDAGINHDKHRVKGKSLELTGSEAIREVVEEVSSREGELDMEVSTGLHDPEHCSYEEQLEEATKALLNAGQYLESETLHKEFLSSGYLLSRKKKLEEQDDDNDDDEEDDKGSGPYLPMVGRVKHDVDVEACVDDDDHGHGHSLLSSVGLDWLFDVSEPDQPPGSPKPVSAGAVLRSRSESPRSSSSKLVLSEPVRESRDSSHGSSGTDTETRALLTKLECVENILEQSSGASGAIPKRKSGRRVRSSGHRSGSLDEGGRVMRERRTGLEEEYEIPTTSQLHDDAAGLKLFLDFLTGPDGHNEEAQAELRKLIDKRRHRMHEPSHRRKHSEDAEMDHDDSELPSRRKRLATRRRRHNAQTHDSGGGDESKTGDNKDGIKKREKRSRRHRDNVPHIATDHDDTSQGAVHCFKDEFGNWQTYTFGGDSLVSSAVGDREGQALASLLTKERRDSGDQQNSDQGQETAGAVVSKTPDSSRSSLSADSSLTVILDSPAMVFQPSADSRTRSVESGHVPRSRDSGVQQYWSRENSVLSGVDYRLYSGQHSTGSTGTTFRRYNNPLHIFDESFIERIRAGVAGAAASNAELTFSSSFATVSAAGLTRIDESSLQDQLNLCSGVAGQLNVPSHLGTISSVPKLRKYHLLNLPGLKTGVKIWLDRLQLLNILDQDKNPVITVSAVLLSILVSILGSMVLQTGYYRDLCLILFCAVQASCHYSLLKSVQPDASSPTHGFNSVTVFSRPIYFIMCCSLILLLDSAISAQVPGLSIYGTRAWLNYKDLTLCRDFVIGFILAFPLIFTIGLLPQINTALMYLLETVDVHVFGGNASTSLQASVYCVIRSCVAVVIMFGFAYGGLTEGGQTESSHTEHAQQVLFSIFCSLSVVISYHLSRSSSDPTVILSLLKRHLMAVITETETVADTNNVSNTNSGVQSPLDHDPAAPQDPLPKKLRDTVNARLKNDAIICSVSAIVVFLVHQSDVFVQAFPTLDIVLWSIAIIVGFLLHYLLPHLRKQTPWKCFAAPILAPFEQTLFEVRGAARVMWWEKCLLWSSCLERSVLYPLILLSAVTHDREVINSLFGTWAGSLIMTLTLTKCLRSVWSDSSKQYFTLLLCILLFQYDPLKMSFRNIVPDSKRTSPFVLDYFLTTILTHKLVELYLKCQFVITYIAPHQINWGSAFHAFAQPFSVPHSAMLFIQAIISSILSSPLNPLLGSTIFICSYVRPVKFWERNYSTKRTDHSNTRLASQFEVRNPGADDNNLNSIFYEHLTRSLQHSLAGDLMLGRWGSVQQGDFFILASDYLNCLVHIIELGNGLCTFQVRGLEFKGTYCQSREIEAISEGVEEDEGCCCCDPGHLPHMLSVNAAFGQRWLAWEVSAAKYVLEGYSISDNVAQNMLQVNMNILTFRILYVHTMNYLTN